MPLRRVEGVHRGRRRLQVVVEEARDGRLPVGFAVLDNR